MEYLAIEKERRDLILFREEKEAERAPILVSYEGE